MVTETIETMRIKVDQTVVFKIIHGFEDIYKSKFFKLREANITRECNLMTSKHQSKLDIKYLK